MVRFRKYFFLWLISMLATALISCNRQVADFVDGARRPLPDTTTPTLPVVSIGINSPMYFKVTPSQISMPTTNSGAIHATATMNNRIVPLTGGMAMSVTISRSRSKPQ